MLHLSSKENYFNTSSGFIIFIKHQGVLSFYFYCKLYLEKYKDITNCN